MKNEFETALTFYIDKNQLKKIEKITIGIAGAGGLGSNVAFNLVRSGFCNFIIADFDIVSYSNLNRQFFFYNQVGEKKVSALCKNLLSINPNLNIKTYDQKINQNNIRKIFKNTDAIIEAFDKPKYKKLIIETYINSNKLIIAASGIAGFGKSDEIKTHKIKNNLYIIGDLKTEANQTNPPLSPKVNIAAAKQADIVLEYFLS